MDHCRWTIHNVNESLIREFQAAVKISRPTAVALASNGLTLESLDDYLNPKLGGLVDPYDFPGCRDAAKRIWQAVRQGESILIHGDYDADGITAAALVAEVLAKHEIQVETFLPHRIEDGYGLTPESIEKACAEHHSLLITVDCGITSHSAVEAAQAKGIDVIVTDHHEPAATLPGASVIIDPRLPDTPEKLRDLAGVGVAFKLCHAFIKLGREQGLGAENTDLKEVLDLVALGTVADIVPLLNENRRLVKAGLAVLSRQHRPGVRALCELASLNEKIQAPDIAFRLAPRLNAAGRMGDANLSLKLLRADNMRDAMALAKKLESENRCRQREEVTTYEAARKQIEERERASQDTNFAMVAADDNWHQGVLGIVASRLVREYHRPCIVLAKDSTGMMSGSGRSVPGVNLVKTLALCDGLLARYGGHPMAAGLSIKPDSVDELQTRLNRAIAQVLAPEDICPQLAICGETTFREIIYEFLHELDFLQPFGQGNPEPVFYTRDVTPERISLVGNNHTRGILRDPRGDLINFIAFGCLPEDFPPAPWDVAYRAQINTYRNKSTPQALVLDVRAL